MENKSKMKIFDFGAFQINMHMASREKYIFHMLFGAFHITPRIMTHAILVSCTSCHGLLMLTILKMIFTCLYAVV